MNRVTSLLIVLGLAACGGKAPTPAPTTVAPTTAAPTAAAPTTATADAAPTTAAPEPTVAAPDVTEPPAPALDPEEKVDIDGGVVPREQTKQLVIPAEAPSEGAERSILASSASIAFEDSARNAAGILRTPLRRWFITVDGSPDGVSLTLVAPDNTTEFPLGKIPPYTAPDCKESSYGCDPFTEGSLEEVVAARQGRTLTVTLEMTRGDRGEGPRVTQTFPIPDDVLARAAKLEELPKFEPPPEPDDPAEPGEPTGDARKRAHAQAVEGRSLEEVDAFFEGGVVGRGDLKNAARIRAVEGEASTSFLLVEGPDGWTRIAHVLLDTGEVGHGHAYEHKETASALVDDPVVGPVLVIDVERADTYAWGEESLDVRWYCFVHERQPRCVEVALAYDKEDRSDEENPEKTSWSREVTLDSGKLVVGKAKGKDAPGPAAGAYALVDAASTEGLAVHASEPVAAP